MNLTLLFFKGHFGKLCPHLVVDFFEFEQRIIASPVGRLDCGAQYPKFLGMIGPMVKNVCAVGVASAVQLEECLQIFRILAPADAMISAQKIGNL